MLFQSCITAIIGKPIVTVSLFGDQYRNGRAAERNGFGVPFDKMSMSAENLAKALRKILTDERFVN